jgi:uncharacterized membrane-anchored protein YitT (DUF2179 family)
MSSIGIIILGLSLNYISWQYTLVSSGLPGYALGMNFLMGFPVGTFLLIANTLILVLSFLIAGKSSGLRGVYGYVLLSVFIDWSRRVFGIHQVVLSSFITNALLIIIQGAVAPLAIALVMAHGYSFGSYSSMIPIVKKFSTISAPKFFLIMDSILAVLTFILFGYIKAILLAINAIVFFVVFRFALSGLEKSVAHRI